MLTEAVGSDMEVDGVEEVVGEAEVAAVTTLATQGISMSVADMPALLKMSEAPAGLQEAFHPHIPPTAGVRPRELARAWRKNLRGEVSTVYLVDGGRQ